MKSQDTDYAGIICSLVDSHQAGTARNGMTLRKLQKLSGRNISPKLARLLDATLISL